MKLQLELAPDIKTRTESILKTIDFPHIKPNRLRFFRSYGSKARARARIWSFPRIWQMALKLKSHYVIEVISEKFDTISYDDQTRVLIHELLHIPKTFSGALVPHRGKGRRHQVHHKIVDKLFKELKNKL